MKIRKSEVVGSCGGGENHGSDAVWGCVGLRGQERPAFFRPNGGLRRAGSCGPGCAGLLVSVWSPRGAQRRSSENQDPPSSWEAPRCGRSTPPGARHPREGVGPGRSTHSRIDHLDCVFCFSDPRPRSVGGGRGGRSSLAGRAMRSGPATLFVLG